MDLSYLSEADRCKTPYRSKIKQLYRDRRIVPSRAGSPFNCFGVTTDGASCLSREYHRGTWPYVGAKYGDHGVRILFVAMDRGSRYDLELEPTFEDTQHNFRIGCECRRNPHMGGVAQIMEFLSKNQPAEQRSLQFALTNAVKCAKRTGNQHSTANETMKRNCHGHLEAEIAALEPHIVITQGVPPAKRLYEMQEWATIEIFDNQKERKGSGVSKCPKLMQVGVFVSSAVPYVFVSTPHPARCGWPYVNGVLPDCVRQGLKCAMAH